MDCQPIQRSQTTHHHHDLLQERTNDFLTTLPKEWKELYPDLAEWFGIPLLLLKLIYGSTDSARNWDDTLAHFLLQDFGFERCPRARSIYVLKKTNNFIFLLNAVDDELYFSNSNNLQRDFENRVTKRFDAELISLDQTRYMALITARFLPEFSTTNITTEDKEKYTLPLQPKFVATKTECYENLLAVQELQEQFGFYYSSAVGMLIFLLNTAITLHFGIRKLAKCDTLPGESHYKALIHLLHHIRTQRTKFKISSMHPNPLHQSTK